MHRLIALVLALAACGGTARQVRPAAWEAFPVLARVPAGSHYVLAAARLGDAAAMVRDLVAALVPLGSDAALDPAALADAGFDLTQSAAVFGRAWPTFLLPVADAARVDAYVAKALGDDAKVTRREHRGQLVVTYREGTRHVSFTHVGRWLAAHAGEDGSEPEGTAWLDDLADVTPRFPASEAAAWLAAQVRTKDPGALAWADLVALDRALAPSAPPECAARRRAFAARWDRVAAAARFAPGRLVADALVTMPPARHKDLAAHVSPLPPGAAAARDQAAFWVGWNVDLGWLAVRADPVPEADRCGGLAGLDGELDLAVLALLLPGVRTFHAAVLGARDVRGLVELSALGWVLASPEGAAAVTAKLSAGAAPERALVDGVEIARGRHPLLADPVEWTQVGERFRIGVGAAGRELTREPAAGADPRDLASLRIVPSRMPDLLPLFLFLHKVVFGEERGFAARLIAETAARTLSRLDRLAFTLRLEDTGVRVDLDVGLR